MGRVFMILLFFRIFLSIVFKRLKEGKGGSVGFRWEFFFILRLEMMVFRILVRVVRMKRLVFNYILEAEFVLFFEGVGD